jgi:hypothetical protein
MSLTASELRKNKLFTRLILLFAYVFLASFLVLRNDNHKGNTPQKFIVDSFSFENRLNIFFEMDKAASVMWNSKKNKVVSKMKTQVLEKYPLLQLYDRNDDRKPDQFAFTENEKNQNTKEFGFFYDLNQDGRIDYMIFNGGTTFSSDFSKMIWLNYHWIDSNNDGKFDIIVYNGVNLTGKELVDEGKSAWIYDRNYDGIFEKAEYLGKDFQQDIIIEKGSFLVKTAMGDYQFPERQDLSFHHAILEKVSELLSRN